MDANEHVSNGPLRKDLVNDDIGLVEATHASTSLPTPLAVIDGSKPIDGVWHTSNIELTNIKVLPSGDSVGDHHSCVLHLLPLPYLVNILVGSNALPASNWSLLMWLPKTNVLQVLKISSAATELMNT